MAVVSQIDVQEEKEHEVGKEVTVLWLFGFRFHQVDAFSDTLVCGGYSLYAIHLSSLSIIRYVYKRKAISYNLYS